MRAASPADAPRAPESHASARMLAFSLPRAAHAGLVVGPVDDPYEREASRVADEVTRDAGPRAAPVLRAAPPALRRCGGCGSGGPLCAECAARQAAEGVEGAEGEPVVRRKETRSSPAATGHAGGARPAAAPGYFQPSSRRGAAAESIRSGLTGGRPLGPSERAYFEPRFAASFDGVRIHDHPAADVAARSIQARAFTLGHDIAFARGEYQPGTDAGRKLLAHELAHTLQQGGAVVRRTPGACGACRSGWETTVNDDHARALDMLDNTIAKIASYNGTTPADVQASLDRWFKASSSGFATWINVNLRYLRLMAPLAGYTCEQSTCGLCDVPGRYGWSAWCVPLFDIRVCDPVYFAMSDRRRSAGLVHEWVHKYGCNFDFGYCSGEQCPGGTTRSLFNADPWSKLVLDLG